MSLFPGFDHLTAYPLTVSVRALEEVNRLRLQFRKDLYLYKIPRAAGRKRKLTGVAQAPSAKRVIPNPSRSTKDCVTTHTIPRATARKRRLPSVTQAPSAKKVRPSTSKTTNEDEECLIIHTETHDSPFKFNSVDSVWQQNACQQLFLQYHAPTRVRPGGPTVPLA